MEEKVDVIEITEKEKKELLIYKDAITQELSGLGSLRRQVATLEKGILEKIEKLEEEQMMQLKFIFTSKTSEKIDNWVFDPTTFVFRKRT